MRIRPPIRKTRQLLLLTVPVRSTSSIIQQTITFITYRSSTAQEGLLYHDYNYEFSVANGIALSPTGAVWVCDTNNDFGLYPNPSTGNGNATFTNGFSGTGPIAVDYQGQAWVAGKQGQYGNEALVRSTTGGALTSYAINNYDNQQLGGLNNPVSVAVDGNNVNNGNTFNVWTANTGNNSVTAINSSTQYASLSPSVGVSFRDRLDQYSVSNCGGQCWQRLGDQPG